MVRAPYSRTVQCSPWLLRVLHFPFIWPRLKRVRKMCFLVAWSASYRRLGTSMLFLSQIVIFKIYVGGSLGSVAVLILNLPIHDHLFRSLDFLQNVLLTLYLQSVASFVFIWPWSTPYVNNHCFAFGDMHCSRFDYRYLWALSSARTGHQAIDGQQQGIMRWLPCFEHIIRNMGLIVK